MSGKFNAVGDLVISPGLSQWDEDFDPNTPIDDLDPNAQQGLQITITIQMPTKFERFICEGEVINVNIDLAFDPRALLESEPPDPENSPQAWNPRDLNLVTRFGPSWIGGQLTPSPDYEDRGLLSHGGYLRLDDAAVGTINFVASYDELFANPGINWAYLYFQGEFKVSGWGPDPCPNGPPCGPDGIYTFLRSFEVEIESMYCSRSCAHVEPECDDCCIIYWDGHDDTGASTTGRYIFPAAKSAPDGEIFLWGLALGDADGENPSPDWLTTAHLSHNKRCKGDGMSVTWKHVGPNPDDGGNGGMPLNTGVSHDGWYRLDPDPLRDVDSAEFYVGFTPHFNKGEWAGAEATEHGVLWGSFLWNNGGDVDNELYQVDFTYDCYYDANGDLLEEYLPNPGAISIQSNVGSISFSEDLERICNRQDCCTPPNPCCCPVTSVTIELTIDYYIYEGRDVDDNPIYTPATINVTQVDDLSAVDEGHSTLGCKPGLFQPTGDPYHFEPDPASHVTYHYGFLSNVPPPSGSGPLGFISVFSDVDYLCETVGEGKITSLDITFAVTFFQNGNFLVALDQSSGCRGVGLTKQLCPELDPTQPLEGDCEISASQGWGGAAVDELPPGPFKIHYKITIVE